MGKRRAPRIQAKLQVRIAGVDARGRPVLQMVTTRNISRNGALLEGIQSTFTPGEIISVSYRNDKARFLVAWMGEIGTDKEGQMGVQSIDAAKCIWDATLLPPAAADTYAAQPKERRKHRRVPCKLGSELYIQGADALVRVDITNISMGGCFVAMPTLPPDKSRLRLVIWANEVKVTLHGVVAGRRPGFGISVKFTEMAEEVCRQLEQLIQSQLVVHGR
jgi:PilZ domain